MISPKNKNSTSLEIVEKGSFLYKTAPNLTYMWNFGFLSFICLFIQIITGIFLAMHYMPETESAFNSIEHIMRDMNYGWLLRYTHANGASFFFLCVYLHLLRNMYFVSYSGPSGGVWIMGMMILVLMMLTAFLGYVLPWGQMSFWAATVITSLFSAIPFIGDSMVIWLWGGYAVEQATLTSFYSLHYLLPFIMLLLAILHVIMLHAVGSSNPTGLVSDMDCVPFGPYYLVKDFLSLIIFLMLFTIIMFFYPNMLGHPDNYIAANPLSTPAHMVPEWYFPPFYAILRSVPNKLGGMVALALAMVLLFLLPVITGATNVWSSSFVTQLHKGLFMFFFMICVLLGWLGGQPMDYPYVQMGQILSGLYMLYLLWGIWFCDFVDSLYHKKYINKINKG